MPRMVYMSAAVVALAAVALLPAGGSAASPTPVEAVLHQVPTYEKQYLAAHRKAVGKLGAKPVGRNIVAFGWNGRNGVRHAKRGEVVEATRRLVAAVAPPPEPVYVAAPTESYSGGVPAELEAIAQCESGGDYGAVNSSSGAFGKYQIMPSTAAAYGCDLSTAAGQDACAVEIYAGGAGRSQWVC